MKQYKNLKDKRELLFDIIKIFNPKQHESLKEWYKDLSDEDKIGFIQDTERTGIYIHQPPMWENIGLDVLKIVYSKYKWIEPYDCWIYKHGRRIKMMNKIVAGELYIIKLKHTPKILGLYIVMCNENSLNCWKLSNETISSEAS